MQSRIVIGFLLGEIGMLWFDIHANRLKFIILGAGCIIFSTVLIFDTSS